MKKDKLKNLPVLENDEAAEKFVDVADLSEYDLSGFKPMRFEFEKKAAALNMRIPQNLLDAVKVKAKSQGMPFTRYVRMLIERDLSRP